MRLRSASDPILSRLCVVSLICAYNMLNHRTTRLGRLGLPVRLPFSKPKVNWLLHISLICRNDLLRFVIVETGIGTNDGTTYLIFKYARVRVHGKDDRHTEFVFVWAERTFVVAQFLGQHRQHAIDEIDGRTAFIGVLIRFGTRADIERDIGNVDSDLIDSGAVCLGFASLKV